MTQVLIDRTTLEKALKLAFNLGQTYWQQADSDYVSQQNKSYGTREKFNQLITDTCAAIANAESKDVYAYAYPNVHGGTLLTLQKQDDLENGIPLYAGS